MEKRKEINPRRFILSLLFLILGCLLAGGFYTDFDLIKGPKGGNPEETDSKLKVKGFRSFENGEGHLPIRILIPKVAIDVDVKKAKLVSGYWEVFEDSAGWGEGSGIPGQPGNQVIFAHARKDLFEPLKNIRQNDYIYVLTDSGWRSYSATEIVEISPDQTDVLKPTENETLTLYTCTGFNDSKRLLVIAKPS